MAVVTATAEVDNLSIALDAAENLSLEFYEVRYVGDGFTLVQVCTGEAISPARLLANFWTEYADVSERIPPVDDTEQVVDEVLDALARDRV